jgi:hypothetical protein
MSIHYHHRYTNHHKLTTAYTNLLHTWRELAAVRSRVRGMALKAFTPETEARYLLLADRIGVVQAGVARQLVREPGEV